MKMLVAAVALATLVASPSFAQSVPAAQASQGSEYHWPTYTGQGVDLNEPGK